MSGTAILAALAVAIAPGHALGQPSPVTAPAVAQTSVPLEIQKARRNRFNPDLSTLVFHNMDQLFHTRTVARGSSVWTLPQADHALTADYIYAGVTRPVEEGLERTFTDALLVIRDGTIVHEQYRNQTKPDSRFVSFSMAKSITSLLIGKAVEEGAITSIDDPVTRYLPELKGGSYDKVTIRQVLQMRSGTNWEERYDYSTVPSLAARVSDEVFVQELYRSAEAARLLKPLRAPGSTFNYSSVDTAVLGWVLERATKRVITDYTAAKLWQPLGAEADAYWMLDGPEGVGREANALGFNARLRDYGRLGLMVLNQGKADGRQVVPKAWIAESVRPYAGLGKPAEGAYDYGYQWWTVKGSSAFFALGFAGQYIYVDPASRTVVVKLSHNLTGTPEVAQETTTLLAAIAAATF